MIINGIKYTPIQIIKKDIYDKDIVLCKTEFGYKECFFRRDLKRREELIKREYGYEFWSEDEINMIKEELKKGYSPRQISEMLKFGERSKKAVEAKAFMLRRDERKNESCNTDKV